MKFVQVITTIDSEKKAEEIAQTLLKLRLAACIQILPMKSLYWWKDKIAKTREWLIIAKARETDYSAVEDAIKSIHTYSIPEIIVVPIIRGNKPYLEWLTNETKRN